jgi:hypothetical protein
MKRIVRLNESDLARIVRRVISEQEPSFVGRFRDEYNKFTQMVKNGPNHF